MKLRDRDADASDRRQRPRRSTRSSRRRTAACASARWCATPTSPPTRACGATTACSSRALLAGASGQLRNKATTAGNLLQRTRCPYFYDTNQPCNKRQPGSGCAAIGGFSRQHARDRRERRLHRDPSRATWRWRCARSTRRWRPCEPDGATRSIPIADFHRLPGDTPHIETTLEPGELITAVTLPKPVGGTHIYRKVRDRASYAFALVSVGRDRAARTARAASRSAASRTSRGASRRPRPSCRAAPRPSPRSCSPARSRPHDNAFKLPLVERTLAAVLAEARG